MFPYKCTGGGDFARGEFHRENFSVEKGGEIFPWRKFGGTVPYFTTAVGIVHSERSQERLRMRLNAPEPTVSCADA